MIFSIIALVFVIGYVLIALEHTVKLDKAAIALCTAVIAWTVVMLGADSLPAIDVSKAHATEVVTEALRHHLAEIAEILFFLMGAMTIVELIDAHDGFNIITTRITTTRRLTLLWIISTITFFMSALLDNLTTTIVMVSLLRKLLVNTTERWLFIGIVIIAANAGGAWSPMGDVTTTMLWIGHQITAQEVMTRLFVPSLVCMLVPLLWISFTMRGEFERPMLDSHKENTSATYTVFERNFVFWLGMGVLACVPVFKTVTHLPPYLGILLGLGIIWIATEIVHKDKSATDRNALSVVGVIRRIDTPSILFFLGILLTVAALATAGHLAIAATFLNDKLGNIYTINIAIGLLSSIVDNVPLVAGAMNMYPLTTPEMLANAGDEAVWLNNFVQDGLFWEMLALCAGTGGSCLIIGSAAGVAAMGMEKINFMWYLKKITLLALAGYFAGVVAYILLV